jgi:hypothetical protein
VALKEKVFVTYIPSKYADGEWHPTMNIRQAAKFGELEVMLHQSHTFLPPSNIAEMLRAKLSDFTGFDHLLLLGDANICAMASVIAARKVNGHLRLLSWDKLTKQYTSIVAQGLHT